MSSLIVILFVGAVTSSTSAADSVRLRVGDCVPAKDLVRDLVAIELGFERMVDDNAELVVNVDCGPTRVLVHLHPNPLGVRDRQIPTAEIAREGGARLVALNVVELLQDLEMERLREETLPPAVEVPAPIPPPRPRSARLRISAAPTIRFLPSPARVGVGARASVGLDAAVDAAFPWSTLVSASFDRSSSGVSLGSVRTQVVSGAVAVGERFDLTQELSVFGHLGAAGGWVWLDGSTQDAGVNATSGQGPWFGPWLGARLRYGGAVAASVGVEAGWTLHEVYGEVAGEGQVGLRRGWIGADLAIDWTVGG